MEVALFLLVHSCTITTIVVLDVSLPLEFSSKILFTIDKIFVCVCFTLDDTYLV